MFPEVWTAPVTDLAATNHGRNRRRGRFAPSEGRLQLASSTLVQFLYHHLAEVAVALAALLGPREDLVAAPTRSQITCVFPGLTSAP
jgi:hypothetical protein